MKVDTSKVGLVRGYVVYSQWRAGCISLDRAKDDDCIEVGVAYTLWHRHDDDPAQVEAELEALTRFYTRCRDCDGAMFGFEYREYGDKRRAKK